MATLSEEPVVRWPDLLLESGAESPSVGEVPIQDSTAALGAAAMDAYRVYLAHPVPPHFRRCADSLGLQ